MTSSPETLYSALATLHAMIVDDRKFIAYADCALALGRADTLRMLPMSSSLYRRVVDNIFRLNLLQRDRVGEYQNCSTDAAWLCDSVRNLVYVRPREVPPAHAGITYSVIVVVVTSADDTDAANIKLKLAEKHLHAMEKQLREKRMSLDKARIVRLVLGETPTNVVPIKTVDSLITLETWHAPEIQSNVTKNDLVPRHRAMDSLTEQEVAALPVTIRKAVEPGSDPTKIDALFTTDMMARWYGFMRGQYVLVERRLLLEGGESYTVRFVDE